MHRRKGRKGRRGKGKSCGEPRERSLDLALPSCPTNEGRKSSLKGPSSRRCARPRHNASWRLTGARLSYVSQLSVSFLPDFLISHFKGRTPPPKTDDREFDEYLSKIIGPPRGVDTGELTPSIPGTPSLSNIPMPPGTSHSGRGSRQSNEGSDRMPLDSSFGRYTNSGTDHTVDQCVQPLPLSASSLTDAILVLSFRVLQLISSI